MWGLEKAKELTQRFFKSPESNAADLLMQDEVTKSAIAKQFESDIIAYVKSEYDKRQSERNQLELQWRLNINFYNGEQFTVIDSVRNDIVEVLPLNDWEERNVFNEIAPVVETRLAILSKRKNNLKNRPASSQSEDRTASQIGNKVLASTRSRLNMSDLQQEANMIAGIMSTAIWKTVWDKSAGKVVGYVERKLTDEELNEDSTYEYENELLGMDKDKAIYKIHEGDVVTTVHSPFEIYPENCAKPCREQRKIMHVVLMSPDEVFEKWNKVVSGSDHQTYKVLSTDNKTYGSAFSGRTAGSLFSCSTLHNTVKVYEEWERPTKRYPKGRLIICSDNTLFYYGPLPDAMGENGEYILPFDVQQSVKTDGFFGVSVVERMIPNQIKYNSIKNRIGDYLNRVAVQALVTEENSIVDEDYYLENGIAPGEIISYRRGANPPRYLEPANLPDDMYREIQELLSSFNRLAAVSDLSKQSVVPSQVTSGIAIAGLAEQDDTRIGLEAENIKHCLINVGRKWLVLYHNNVSYPRTVKDIGKNNEFEIDQFRGCDLTSFDVFVESEPESSDTLSQRRQKVIELLNGGLFNDPETGQISKEGRIKVFEMLELGDWENFVEADDEQKKRAQRENNAMVTGQPATLREFDDDMIHISMHNNFRLKAEYEDALTKNPEIDAIFEAHVQEHLQSLQVKSQADAMQAEAPYIQRGSLTPQTFQ